MSGSTVSPTSTKQSLASRVVLATCVAAALLLIAWTTVTLGGPEETEQVYLVIPAPPQRVADPPSVGAGTSVPSASDVLTGREWSPQEPVPTF